MTDCGALAFLVGITATSVCAASFLWSAVKALAGV